MKNSVLNIFASPFVFSFVLIFLISCSTAGFNRQGGKAGIVQTAKQYLGVPYKFGGSTPQGFDCSGFVQFVYKKHAIDVPRTASAQFKKGKKIRFSEARPGDLLFFQTGSSPTSHVVIYSGGLKFIHAPRTGKNVSFSSMNNSYWKKRYRGTVTYRNAVNDDVFDRQDPIKQKQNSDDKSFEFVVMKTGNISHNKDQY